MEISKSKKRRSTEKIIPCYNSVTSFCMKSKIKNPRAQCLNMFHVLKVTNSESGYSFRPKGWSCKWHGEERGLLSRTKRE